MLVAGYEQGESRVAALFHGNLVKYVTVPHITPRIVH